MLDFSRKSLEVMHDMPNVLLKNLIQRVLLTELRWPEHDLYITFESRNFDFSIEVAKYRAFKQFIYLEQNGNAYSSNT